MRYLPHTPDEIASMLEAVGCRTTDELFSSIPTEIAKKARLTLEPGLDELSLKRDLNALAAQNGAKDMLNFLGAGAYDHPSPEAVDQLLLRSELLTAYTPYQAEVAQGTLQIIFEFQTIVSEILGLPVANASMYDAATATAEAVLMARRLTKRDRSVISGCLHPRYAETVVTYTQAIDHGTEALTHVAATTDGCSDIEALAAAINEHTACVVVGYPSFYGTLVDLAPLAEAAHAHGALLVTATQDPYALAIAKPPGACGADIAVAEGQPLGLAPVYGGPGVGLFACGDDRKSLQQLPGRLCGETVDAHGKRGYVLTLATREQHIRRERATSNICTNSGLCATALTIAMSMRGKRGFIETAEHCLAKANYLRSAIANLSGYHMLSDAPLFNELAVVVESGNAANLVKAITKNGVIAGVPAGDFVQGRDDLLLVAVTERHTRADLDRLVKLLGEAAPSAAAAGNGA